MKLIDIVDAGCGSITLPRTLQIHNRRLGLLFRVLQLATCVWVFYNTVYTKAWEISIVPDQFTLEVWAGTHPEDPKVPGAGGLYCENPQSMNYMYSYDFRFDFDDCVDMPAGEAVKKQGTDLFLPTTVHDQYIKKALGAIPCAQLASTCTGEFTNASSAGGTCRCKKENTFFSQMAELTPLHFTHGYAATWLDGSRQRGADKFLARTSSGKSSEWVELDGPSAQMLTVILAPDGSECAVGAVGWREAKSRWTPEDILERASIEGTFEEFLQCAGMSLDQEASSLASGLPEEEGVPRPRIGGAGLKLTFSYLNSVPARYGTGHGAVCEISVEAHPVWDSETSMAYTQVPQPVNGPGEYRTRKAYGVRLHTRTLGKFTKFDYMALINAFVNGLVLLSLPGVIVQFLALYGMGLMSKIYSRAVKQQLKLSRECAGSSVRMTAAAAAFQQLTEVSEKDKDGLSKDGLKNVIREAIGQVAVLDDTELDRLCSFVIGEMDNSGSGKVNMAEFVAAASSNELVEPKDLANFFDQQRSRGILEKVFASSRVSGRARLSRVTPGR